MSWTARVAATPTRQAATATNAYRVQLTGSVTTTGGWVMNIELGSSGPTLAIAVPAATVTQARTARVAAPSRSERREVDREADMVPSAGKARPSAGPTPQGHGRALGPALNGAWSPASKHRSKSR